RLVRIVHAVHQYAVRASAERVGVPLDHPRRLLLERATEAELLVVVQPRLGPDRDVPLVHPDRLLADVLLEQQAGALHAVEDVGRTAIDVPGDAVEEVAVGGGVGIVPSHPQEVLEKVRIAPVHQAGHEHLGGRVHGLHRPVRDLEQLVIVGLAAEPETKAAARIIGLVPDLPGLHAPAIPLGDGPNESAPGVARGVPGLVQAIRNHAVAVARFRPARRADEDPFELEASGPVGVYDLVGARPVPATRAGLDRAPTELPTVPAHARGAREVEPVGLWINVADTEAVVAVGDGWQGRDAAHVLQTVGHGQRPDDQQAQAEQEAARLAHGADPLYSRDGAHCNA